jgi:hypothetical protein
MAYTTEAKFVATLLASAPQAHIYHLATRSYAAHKALNEYYDGIVDLVDGLAESMQGKVGLLSGYSIQVSFNEGDPIKFLSGLADYIKTTRKSILQDSYIQNQVDTIEELVYSTIYKLKELK